MINDKYLKRASQHNDTINTALGQLCILHDQRILVMVSYSRPFVWFEIYNWTVEI